MIKKVILPLFFLLMVNYIFPQSNNRLKEINTVWEKFYRAFDSLDANLMAEIHSKKLIRISGGKNIKNYQEYISGYERNFKRAKENGISNKISLRFFERIHNDSIASERGVYQLTRIKNGKDKQVYYGQFLVLFSKENGFWKILMDYDSNENNSIGETEFLNAYEIDNYKPFESKKAP